MRLLIVLILIYSGFFNAHAQLSKTHYIPPITTAGDNINAKPGEQFLHISTPIQEEFEGSSNFIWDYSKLYGQ
jgi:hypothetical protein